jgi:Chaperonin 10 Kd subunit
MTVPSGSQARLILIGAALLLIIPDTAQEKPQQGKVIAVGPAAATRAGRAMWLRALRPRSLKSS